MSCHSTHAGIAATRHARAVTDLDEAQVASIFHRLKNAHKDTPDPTADEATAALVKMRREVLDDPRLDPSTARSIADRYAHAIEGVQNGNIPDGRTWGAMQATVLEAEIAERNLESLMHSSARHQRKNEERLAATFRKWRRDTTYEDIESPDPQFIINESRYPTDKHTRRALRKMGFENYLAQRLPVFVYGTLRNNQGNDRLMQGAIAQRSEDAQVHGVAVYGAHQGFPYANESPDGEGITRGDLVHLSADRDGDWARERLDTLEGFHSDTYSDSHYRRVARNVRYTDPVSGESKTTQAWVYLAGRYHARGLNEEDRIADGDWVAAKDAYRAARATRTAHSATALSASGAGDNGWDGQYVVTKRAVDSSAAPSTHSASASADVFAQAGLLDND